MSFRNASASVPILILSCFRYEKLKKLIESINSLNLNIPIMIFIDKYQGNDSFLSRANMNVVNLSYEFKAHGLIEDVRVSSNNLKTKKAWHAGVKFVFEKYEALLYIEDDMKIHKSFSNLINHPYETLLKNSILTFYPPKSHTVIKPKNNFVYSDWPNLAGCVFSKEVYTNLCAEDSMSIHKVERIVQERFDQLIYKRSEDRDAFIKIWSWKFMKALGSETAWDTELHLKIWQKNISMLNSATKGVLNTSIDDTNLSKTRAHRDEKNLAHIGRLKTYWKNQNFQVCLRCESIRYFSNGLSKYF